MQFTSERHGFQSFSLESFISPWNAWNVFLLPLCYHHQLEDSACPVSVRAGFTCPSQVIHDDINMSLKPKYFCQVFFAEESGWEISIYHLLASLHCYIISTSQESFSENVIARNVFHWSVCPQPLYCLLYHLARRIKWKGFFPNRFLYSDYNFPLLSQFPQNNIFQNEVLLGRSCNFFCLNCVLGIWEGKQAQWLPLWWDFFFFLLVTANTILH